MEQPTRLEKWHLKNPIEAKSLDPHKLTAMAMFNVEYNDVTPEQRHTAKNATYAAMYGRPMKPTELYMNPHYLLERRRRARRNRRWAIALCLIAAALLLAWRFWNA